MAADRALPCGIRLLIIEAYRPPRLQLEIFGSYRSELLRTMPGLTRAEADRLAGRYVSPLDVAPHVGAPLSI